MARRDADAFAAFYDRTRARVYGLVTRVLRDPGYSEETTQEVYLQVWRSAANYDPAAGSALAWLMTLAHRRAVDRVRTEQAASQRESRYGAANVDPPADHVADSVILRDERRQVADCLDALTDVQRECIQLAYYDGLTYVAGVGTVVGESRDHQIADARRPARPAQMPGGAHDRAAGSRPDRPGDAVRAARRRPTPNAPTSSGSWPTPRPKSPRHFFDEVRAVRETMAVVSAATAVEPPAALRERLLAAVAARHGATAAVEACKPLAYNYCWRPRRLVAIGLGALGVGIALRPPPPTTSTAAAGVRRAGRADRVRCHPDRRHGDGGVLP